MSPPSPKHPDDQCPMSPEVCSLRFATLLQTVDSMKSQLADLHASFFGDGTPQTPGIVIRLDRLERAEASRARLLWLVLGAFATTLVGALAAHHFGIHP